MTNEIRLAFAHPSERSADMTADTTYDRISLRDHIVEVEIGAFQAERGTTQRVCFNVVVEVRPLPADLDDDVDRILSYDKVTEAIAYELGAERLNLLETLAERIAERILIEPQAVRVFVRIEKLDRGPGALGVEIVRSRKDIEGHVALVGEDNTPHPLIVYFGNEMIVNSDLSVWLDRLEALNVPLILCVGLPEQSYPTSYNTAAQRRIDLLAIEQNAWILAAKDKRCVVVETNTELDWAMKHGQISVWAPSKIVLDAVTGPTAAVTQTDALCIWFSETHNAQAIAAFGQFQGSTHLPVFSTNTDTSVSDVLNTLENSFKTVA